MLISFVSFTAFLFSILVVTSSNPINSVVYLIGTFILAAIYLSSQGIYYIALTYIVVYVGAVITLFLFVVIMINLGSSGRSATENRSAALFTQALPLTVVTVVLYTILIVGSNSDMFINNYFSTLFPTIFQYLVSPDYESLSSASVDLGHMTDIQDLSQFSRSLISFTGDSATNSVNQWNQIQSIGLELYTHKAIYLVLVSMVLMVSIIGPIVICGSAKKLLSFKFNVSIILYV